MRKWLVLAAVVSVSGGVSACGGGAASVARPPTSTALQAAWGLSGLRGDEDDDDGPGEYTPTPGRTDPDADGDNDTKDNERRGYYDRDDEVLRGFGQAASEGDRRALVALVDRYYTAASAGDGSTACSILDPALAASIPQSYGGITAPPYTRGAKTCAEVMTLLFGHFRGELTARTVITAIRVDGNQDRVLLGSPAQPAGYIPAIREHGGWSMVSLLPIPLP